jgi:hypothetical protein
MATVKAPAGNINQTIAGVAFVDGVAETTDTWALAYFTRHGYTIDTNALPASLSWSESKDPESMTVAELRDYADASGVSLDGLTKKADILAAILLPGKPTSVVGTPGNAQISVAYVAPSDTGPGTISGYEVGILNLDDEEAEEGIYADAASPYVETGLTNGDEYRVRVRAINQYGTGPWSDPHTSTPSAG